MISICLLTYNHQDAIKNSLPHLMKQATDHFIDDIFVLDNASDDRTVHYIKQYFSHIPIHQQAYIKSYSACVNKALQIARYEYVIILLPCFVSITFSIDTIKKAFQDPLLALLSFSFISCGIHQHITLSPHFRLGVFDFKYRSLTACSQSQNIFSFLPNAICFRKDLCLLLGGICPNFSTAFACHEFAYRVHKRGFKILSDPHLSLRLIKPLNFKRDFLSKDHFLLFWMHNNQILYWLFHVLFIFISFIFFFLSYQRAFFSAFLRIRHVFKRPGVFVIKDKYLLSTKIYKPWNFISEVKET